VISTFVYAVRRSPFGRYGGALARTRPDDLAAAVIRGLLEALPGFDSGEIGDVVWGNANGAGEDNRNVGRMAVLLAGLPVGVPATTVNRLCGSSLDAVMIASRTIESGDAEVVLAGGVESMTRAPWVLTKPDRAFPAGDTTAVSTTLGWRLVNPAMPAEWTVSLGECNEQLQEKFAIPRQLQDQFAVRSHQLAHAAWDAGFYDSLVVPVADLARDESIRPDASVESLASLKPAFRPEGTITAGNASPLSDGASAVSLAAAPTPSNRPCSAARRWRPPNKHCAGPASPGAMSPPSNSTKRSPCSHSPVSTPGASTPRSSTCAAAPSPSATHSAPPAAA
jgi:acetyl-CoA acyltransferase